MIIIYAEDTEHIRCTTDDVADFLTRIKLPQYVETFRAEDINGEILLGADPDILDELGVRSPLHKMKIMQLFRREIQGTVVKYPVEHVSKFLQQYKLNQCISNLEANEIDGDMILGVEKKLMESVLKEIGVKPLDANRIRSKYKSFSEQT